MLSYLIESFLRNKPELYLYVEKFDKHNGCVLVDFIDSNEFAFFGSLYGVSYNWEQKPTMLELCNYSQRRLQEGAIYRMSKEVLSILIKRILIVEDSLLVGFRIELIHTDPEIFGKSKSFSQLEKYERNIEQFNTDSLDFLGKKPSSKAELVVRNVGQGSWNEIYDAHKICKLVYDLGTIYTTKKTQILAMSSSRNSLYQRDKPSVILSHWDVDHYHFLLGFDDATIKSFPLFIYRGIIPNLTARKVIGRFLKLGSPALRALPPEIPPSGKKSSDVLKAYYYSTSKDLLLFNGSSNRSRNKSAIALAIRKKNSSVVLSADLNYAQVSKYILPSLNYACSHYLVVPHHGGNAGKVMYTNHKLNTLKDAVISVGANPYHPSHPFPKTISELKKIGFKVVRTDTFGKDVIIKL